MLDYKSLDNFFTKYPTMQRVVSHKRGATCIAGIFSFIAKDAHHGDMALSYNLLFEFDSRNSEQYPTVYETRGVIPREEDYHIQSDASICLGSPIQLHEFMKGKPTLCDFSDQIVIPYLYAVTLKLLHYDNGRMVYGELSHGFCGLYEDLEEIFSLKSPQEVCKILQILTMQEKLFEQSLCPFCKTKKIGKCIHRQKLKEYQEIILHDPNYAILQYINPDAPFFTLKAPFDQLLLPLLKKKSIIRETPIGIMELAHIHIL